MASTEDVPAPDHPSELVAQEQRADQEPQLKYERLGGDVGSILEHDKASCLKASEKILALGSQQGVIHILDYSGNEVLRHHVPVLRYKAVGPSFRTALHPEKQANIYILVRVQPSVYAVEDVHAYCCDPAAFNA